MLQELNTENFEESIKDGIKIVVFTASWCGYCQMQKPILKEIAEQNIWIGEVDSKIRIWRINMILELFLLLFFLKMVMY